jgi:hypothetical protein
MRGRKLLLILLLQYLAVGGTCAAFFASFGMGWQRLPKKSKPTKKPKKDSVAIMA